MKKRKVISDDALPSRIPVTQAVVCWLALDHWHAPQWLYGAMGLVFVLAIIAGIVGIAKQEKVDIFEPTCDKKP